MITIQISSDPYKRMITYERLDGDKFVAIDINNPDTPEKLRLLSADYSSCFFPFKAYEIAELIWRTYSTNSTPVCIRFRGTTEEYRELFSVCKILNENNSKLPAEEQLPPLVSEQANEYLANAGDILPEVTDYFKSINGIVDSEVKSEESKRTIALKKAKFDDVSKKEIPICVIGNYSSGKSTFINSLLGCEVLPSGDKPLTAKIYEIRCSDNSEVADVKFISNFMEVTIALNRIGYTIRPDSYNDALSDKIRVCLENEKENPLPQRVQALLQVINDGEIEDRVKIHIPFHNASPLRNSEHPYVLFDTPGDNVANHEHHIQVLQEALHGMSNGLMLYVTVSNQLHTMSNQLLCDKVKEIQEIDTRFTMVIVNQADNADFSEYSRKEIIESPIPLTLQPEGIYYVSSVMALGSKIGGNFIKDNNAMIYEQKKGCFLKKKGERFSQLLYLYNVAPKQIENDSEAGAMLYSECGDEERIFANSGLWSIEQEIQRFADNYAPYNKCYQSLLYSKEVQEVAKADIANAISMHDKSRSEYQSQLESGTQKVLAQLTVKRDEYVEKVLNGYAAQMEKPKKEAYAPISKDELVKLEEQLTSRLETAKGFSLRTEVVDKAWEKAIKLQNVFKADVRADMANSFKYWRDKNAELDQAREQIDTTVADLLLTQVKEKFNQAVDHAKEILFHSSRNYWKAMAEELRKELLCIVLSSPDISQEKREELQGLIEGFEQITFSVEVEKIFEKEKYEKPVIFKFLEDHHLNKRKLANRFNASLREGVDDAYIKMRNNHKMLFIDWQKRLFSEIEDHITELNPELKSKKNLVAYYEGLIASLRAAQEALNAYIEKINSLMDWNTMEEENLSEE